WVEASLEIIVPIAAVAFSFAAAYALAEKNLELISTALAAGEGAPLLAALLLAVLVGTGVLVGAALVAAAPRLRLRVVRRGGRWAGVGVHSGRHAALVRGGRGDHRGLPLLSAGPDGGAGHGPGLYGRRARGALLGAGAHGPHLLRLRPRWRAAALHRARRCQPG